MQQLALTTNISLNDLIIKSVITDIPRITQERASIAFGETSDYEDITKVFYIKTSSKVQITLTKISGSVSFDIEDTCLVTDAFTAISIENIIADTTAEIFVACG